MHSDLGITVLVIHFADGRVMPMGGGYFTNPSWWWAQLHWGKGNWRYLGNDNVKGGPRWRARLIS